MTLLTLIAVVCAACLGGLILLMILLALVGRVPLKYNLRNLLVRWPVSLMTMAAFTLVVALTVGLLAFVQGLYRLTESSGVPGNVMVLADGATDELFSDLGYGDIAKVERWPGVLADEDGTPLSSREVYVTVNQPIPGAEKALRKRRFLLVRGVEDPQMSGRVHNLPLHEGGLWFDARAGVQELPGRPGQTAVQAVIGEGIARDLGKDQGKATLAPGDVFPLGDEQCIVTGVLNSAGSTFDSEVWIKFTKAKDMFGKKSYSTFVVRTAGYEAAKEVAESLRQNFNTPAVNARPEKDYYESLNTTNIQFLVAFGFMSAIMGVGGVFGVMNAMFAAISQRSKDIGVLRIIGYAPWQILVSFFLETMILALVGGLVGCALAFVINGQSMSSILSSGFGGGKSVVLKLTVSPQILAIGMFVSLAMGAVGGFFPALSAMWVRPLESLR